MSVCKAWYSTCLVATAVGVLWWYAPVLSPANALRLLPSCLIVLAGHRFTYESESRHHVSFFGASLTLVLLIAGLPLALWSTVLATAIDVLLSRRNPAVALFHISHWLLSLFAAHLVFTVTGSDLGHALEHPLVPVGMSLIFAITHLVLRAIGHFLTHRNSLYQALCYHIDLPGLLICLIGQGLAILGAGVLWQHPLWAVVLAPVVVLLYLTLARYFQAMDRARSRGEQLEQALYSLTTTNNALVRALTAAIDARDPYTRGHSERVSQYAVAVARRVGLTEEEIRRVHLASLLHDIGKLGVDDRILRKEGPLDEQEWVVMKHHPVIGAAVLQRAEVLRELIPGVRWHHEWINGCGYPDGLAGPEIPIDARIIGVADAFDAMTSHRPYRGALSVSTALDRLEAARGKQFEPLVVDTLLAAVASGEIRVTEQPHTTLPPDHLTATLPRIPLVVPEYANAGR